MLVFFPLPKWDVLLLKGKGIETKKGGNRNEQCRTKRNRPYL